MFTRQWYKLLSIGEVRDAFTAERTFRVTFERGGRGLPRRTSISASHQAIHIFSATWIFPFRGHRLWSAFLKVKNVPLQIFRHVRLPHVTLSLLNGLRPILIDYLVEAHITSRLVFNSPSKIQRSRELLEFEKA
jgi:hypothetical protein